MPVLLHRPDFFCNSEEKFLTTILGTFQRKLVKIQSIVSEEKFFKENVYQHTRTWLSLYESVINRIIKEICIHKLNRSTFLWIMHLSYEITQSTKGK